MMEQLGTFFPPHLDNPQVSVCQSLSRIECVVVLTVAHEARANAFVDDFTWNLAMGNDHGWSDLQ